MTTNHNLTILYFDVVVVVNAAAVVVVASATVVVVGDADAVVVDTVVVAVFVVATAVVAVDDADATVAVVVIVVVVVVSFIHISSLFFAFLLSFHDAAYAATGHFFKKKLKRVVEQKNGKKVVRYSFLGFFSCLFLQSVSPI
jgi:hypothetical protein